MEHHRRGRHWRRRRGDPVHHPRHLAEFGQRANQVGLSLKAHLVEDGAELVADRIDAGAERIGGLLEGLAIAQPLSKPDFRWRQPKVPVDRPPQAAGFLDCGKQQREAGLGSVEGEAAEIGDVREASNRRHVAEAWSLITIAFQFEHRLLAGRPGLSQRLSQRLGVVGIVEDQGRARLGLTQSIGEGGVASRIDRSDPAAGCQRDPAERLSGKTDFGRRAGADDPGDLLAVREAAERFRRPDVCETCCSGEKGCDA